LLLPSAVEIEAFYAVAAGLEEFAVHLVQPALVHIEALHPSAPAESLEEQEAPLAGPPRQQQPGGGVWDYSWVEVLWELGLTHKNPMVSYVGVLLFLFIRMHAPRCCLG
jgi:hypothetical protein